MMKTVKGLPEGSLHQREATAGGSRGRRSARESRVMRMTLPGLPRQNEAFGMTSESDADWPPP